MSFIVLAIEAMLAWTQTSDDVVSIEVKIMDCRDPDSYTYLAELDVFRDGKKFRSLTPKDNEFVYLDSVEAGVYVFRYKNMFDVIRADTLIALTRGKHSLTICLDSLDYSKEDYVPVIDRLRAGESYTVLFESQGCFHSTEDTLTVSRSGESFSATHRGQTKLLDAGGLAIIRHFELELNHKPPGGCTTADQYTITYNKKVVRKTEDGSCEWRGFSYLLNDLGFVKR